MTPQLPIAEIWVYLAGSPLFALLLTLAAYEAGVTIYEIAIPWSRLAPMLPSAGKTFRGTFTVGDADAQAGKGYNYLAWTRGIAYGKDMANAGVLTLGE